MIDETQTIQGETGQPAPQTQAPQDTEDSTIQQTIDQRALESESNAIRVPGAEGSSIGTNEDSASVASSSNNGIGFDIGLGLLIAMFVLGLSFILLLARIAIKNTPKSQNNS